jgi:hypothetical protein
MYGSPEEAPAGTLTLGTFADPHGDHTHIMRNEGDAVARTFAIQLIPAGVARRIDFEDPGNCHF